MCKIKGVFVCVWVFVLQASGGQHGTMLPLSLCLSLVYSLERGQWEATRK